MLSIQISSQNALGSQKDKAAEESPAHWSGRFEKGEAELRTKGDVRDH